MSNSSNFIFSAISVGIAEIITLPISTVRTIYQNTNNTSIRAIVKEIYYEGGIRSFYRAIIPAVSLQICSSASKYTLYRYLENSVHPKYSYKFINGMISGIIVSAIMHPIDFIKVHVQMRKPILKTLKQDYTILYRGYSKSFHKSTIGTTICYPLYDYGIKWTGNVTYASLISAIAYAIILHPVDYFKTRHIYDLPWFQGWQSKHFFKGLSLTLLRSIPHFVIMMTLIDWMNKYIVGSDIN